MANIRTIYGKRYDLDNPQEAAEALRIQRQAQLETAQKKLSPNRQDAPQKKLEAANLLAQNQSLLNARAGVPPVSSNTYNVLSQNNGLLDVAPPNTNIDERAARIRGLLDSQQLKNDNTVSNQVDQSSTPDAQPQPKRTLGQRASGLFDRASNAYMGAAPILAVAQEFQKAGALRPIGTPMQGDPYGKMMEIQQTRQQSEGLANLRQNPQYEQFANLPDDLFIDAIKKQNKFVIENQLAIPNTYSNIETNLEARDFKNDKGQVVEGLLSKLDKLKGEIVLTEYEKRAHGYTELTHGWENRANLILGSVSQPVTSRNLAKKTEEAQVATKGYFNDIRGVLTDNVGGKITVFDKKQANNIIPANFDDTGTKIKSFFSEGEALASYKNISGALTSQLRDSIALTQDPNTQDDKTVMRKANSKIDRLRKLIKITNRKVDALEGKVKGTDDYFSERGSLFENPLDSSGYSGMTEEQAEEDYFGSLDSVFE
tara:strand:- start:10548 stop:12002 length:1455 start_codon:yes stop_codon:yes gene_type:complete